MINLLEFHFICIFQDLILIFNKIFKLLKDFKNLFQNV